MSSIDFLSWSSIYKSTYLSRSAPILTNPDRAWLHSWFRSRQESCVSSEELTWTIDSSTALQVKSALIETKHNDTSNWSRTSYFVLLKSHWIPIDCKERQTERFLWDRSFTNLRSRYLWRTNFQRRRLFILNSRLTRPPEINFPKARFVCDMGHSVEPRVLQ